MAYKKPAFSARSSHGSNWMPDDPHFNAEAFLRLAPDERIRLCAQAAIRSHRSAKSAPEEHQVYYLEIAQQWLTLAEAIIKEGYSGRVSHAQDTMQ